MKRLIIIAIYFSTVNSLFSQREINEYRRTDINKLPVEFKSINIGQLITPEIKGLILNLIDDWVFVECENYIIQNQELSYCFHPDSLTGALPNGDLKRYRSRYGKIINFLETELMLNDKIKSLVIYTNQSEAHLMKISNLQDNSCDNYNVTPRRVLNNFFHDKVDKKNQKVVGLLKTKSSTYIVYPFIVQDIYKFDVIVEYNIPNNSTE
jgi:hypothetical protein